VTKKKKKKKQANTGGRVSHSFPHHDHRPPVKLVHTVECASFSRLLTFLTNHPTEAFGVFRRRLQPQYFYTRPTFGRKASSCTELR